MDVIEKTWPVTDTSLPENALLLNVETTGLRPSSSFVCMISAGYRKEDLFFLRTMLIGSRQEEPSLLEEVQKLASSFQNLYSFGGNAFAFRFLKDRYAGCSDAPLFPSGRQIDLQKELRPLQRILPLNHLKKADVEKFLSFHRAADRTGKELIPIYGAWERSRIPEAREVLLAHGEEDIRSLVTIYRMTAYADFLHGVWNAVCLEEEDDAFVFTVRLKEPVPVPLSYKSGQASVFMENDLARICVVPFRGCLRYFLPGSYRDYYYLPAEDTAIHKSVAQFVDKSQRVKASPENCYMKREGVFLPVPAGFPDPVFCTAYRAEPYYTQYEKQKWQQDISLMEKYIAAIV